MAASMSTVSHLFHTPSCSVPGQFREPRVLVCYGQVCIDRVPGDMCTFIAEPIDVGKLLPGWYMVRAESTKLVYDFGGGA